LGLAPAEQGKSYPEPYSLLGYGPETYQRHEDMSTWLVPTIGGNTEPLSPIVTWWAMLYVLSMLARYQPSAWTTMLDIDSSPDAPAVEYLLGEAHRACVNLIVAAFKTVEQEAYWQDMAEDQPDE
jgi:hypothetical protein